MKNKNVLCCVNDNPLFSYQTLQPKEYIEQLIINFVTEKNKIGPWIYHEKAVESKVALIYYEVNVEKAFLLLKQGTKAKKTEVEKFCLTFLNYFLEETSENLIAFLASTKTFKEKELEEIKKTFQ